MKKISFRTDVLPLKNELYRLALRITLNPADAEDVVQETMMKIWNRRAQWEQIESMEAFCLTICRNLALDKTRKMGNLDQSLDTGEHDTPDHSYAANPEDDESVIPVITRPDFEQYKADGTISGGMLPKIENALDAVEAGVSQVIITLATAIDGQHGTIIK